MKVEMCVFLHKLLWMWGRARVTFCLICLFLYGFQQGFLFFRYLKKKWKERKVPQHELHHLTYQAITTKYYYWSVPLESARLLPPSTITEVYHWSLHVTSYTCTTSMSPSRRCSPDPHLESIPGLNPGCYLWCKSTSKYFRMYIWMPPIYCYCWDLYLGHFL